MKRSIGVVALSLVLAMSASPAMAQTDTATTKTARVKAAGISLKYPSEWTVYALTKKDVAAQRKALAKRNPELAAAFDANEFAGKAKFYAADLAAGFRGEPVSNINVLVVPAGGFPSDLNDFESVLRPQYASLGANVLDVTEAEVGGKTAYRADVTLPITLPNGEQFVARMAQLYAPLRGGGSVTTVTSSNDTRGAQIVDDVINSVNTI